MATYAAVLAYSQTVIAQGSTVSSGDLYTCPSGKVARVLIASITTDGPVSSLDIVRDQSGMANEVIAQGTTSAGFLQNLSSRNGGEYWLEAGDVLRITAGATTNIYKVVVLEYTK